MSQQHRELRFTASAVEHLVGGDWPGNVRQLRNLVDRLAVFAEDDEITPETVEAFTVSHASVVTIETADLTAVARSLLRAPGPNRLEAIEHAMVKEAMAQTGGSKTAAAELLGVHRKAVERRVEKWRLDARADKEDGG